MCIAMFSMLVLGDLKQQAGDVPITPVTPGQDQRGSTKEGGREREGGHLGHSCHLLLLCHAWKSNEN